MKKRYLYALLFGIPGFFVAGIISLVVFGALMGVLWIFVFGDDPWPSSADAVISVLLVFIFLLLWTTTMIAGYIVGGKLERDPQLNQKHILISSGLTLLFILLIMLQQFSVGNLGPKSDSVLCSEFCAQKGYVGSGMPPRDSGDRSCSCYDSEGNEVLKVPVESITPDASQ